MVNRIKIDINVAQEKIVQSIREFYSKELICLEDIILTEDSKCGKYEYIYVFCDNEIFNSLLRIMLDNKVVIFETKDVTEHICNIINSNKLEDFKSELCQSSKDNFDELISTFIFEHVTKDMVLDKINALGINALTEQDYSILKS
jgi:hypothetical protein